MDHPENSEEYKGLQVNAGVAQQSIVNPYLQRGRFRRREISVADMVEGIIKGNVTILSQAVTLVESVNPAHQVKAQEVIEKCLPYSGNSIRIGISGVPGAGKSTWVKENYPDAVVISRDAIREELGFVKPGRKVVLSRQKEDKVSTVFNQRLTDAARDGTKTIVLDNLRDSKHICIFYNVTNGILDIIERLDITQYKIFCSEESVKKLKSRGITEAYSQIDYPLAKYNFFTCRFYSALDIRISKYKPDIIMLTDLHTALWTMIDPFTEAIQIQGRFRKRGDDDVTYNSLTHITNVNPEIPVLSREEVNRMVEQSAANYNMLKECRDTQANNLKRKAISDDMKNMRYQDLIDEHEEINYFAVDK